MLSNAHIVVVLFMFLCCMAVNFTPRCGVPKLHVWLRLQHVQMQLILKHDDHPTHLGAVGRPTTRQRGTLHDAGTPVREGIMRANCGAVGPSSRLQGSTKHSSFP